MSVMAIYSGVNSYRPNKPLIMQVLPIGDFSSTIGGISYYKTSLTRLPGSILLANMVISILFLVYIIFYLIHTVRSKK